MLAWWEAGGAWVQGLHVATILLAQTVLEHILAGYLVLSDPSRNPAHSPKLSKLLRDARAQGVLSDDEYELFDRLRRQRNPYAHHRAVLDPETLGMRSLGLDRHPDEVLEDDAWSALQALTRLLNSPRFGLGEVR